MADSSMDAWQQIGLVLLTVWVVYVLWSIGSAVFSRSLPDYRPSGPKHKLREYWVVIPIVLWALFVTAMCNPEGDWLGK
jgi:hypothetical protein